VVAHSSLISWLCEEENVDLYADDIDAPTMKPITNKIMGGFMKDYMEYLRKIQVEEGGAPRPPPQPQPQ